MAANKKVVVTMTKERETKRTFRFKEDGDEDKHKLGSLYLQKPDHEKLDSPDNIKVTVENDDS